MTETQQTRQLDAKLKAKGVLVTVTAGGMLQKSGLPDREYAHPSMRGALKVEWKAGSAVPTDLQRYRASEMLLCWVPVCWGRFEQQGEDTFVVLRHSRTDEVLSSARIKNGRRWRDDGAELVLKAMASVRTALITRMIRAEQEAVARARAVMPG